MPYARCDARGDDALAREGTEREASSGRPRWTAGRAAARGHVRNFKLHQPIPVALARRGS